MGLPLEECYDDDVREECLKRLNDTGTCAGCPIWDGKVAEAEAKGEKER